MLQMVGYKQLSMDERQKIHEMRQSGTSRYQIASALGRSRSTVGRELKRNKAPYGDYYLPDTAQGLAIKRKKKRPRLEREGALRDFVVDHLCALGWSPEQMAGFLKHRQSALPAISHESIYAWIYSSGRKDEKLWQHLPRHKKKRGLRKSYQAAGVRTIPQRTSIHERPAVIGEKQEVGHWEGDLISCSKNTQFVFVAHERKTRFLMAHKLENKRAQHTAEIGAKLFRPLPAQARKSITLDNGGEFAQHTQWREELKIDTYFCDPYASWQKGGVENSNGRLRRDLPRKTDLNTLTQEDIDDIILTHNMTPRKNLGWLTPLEAFTNNLNNRVLA